jgi:hypothetical protein
MKSARRMAILPLLFLLSCSGHRSDVKGWESIRWGNTLTNAKALLGPEAHEVVEKPPVQGTPKLGYRARLGIDGMSIGGIKCSVLISTPNDSDKIIAVQLSSADNLTDNLGARASEFQTFMTLLTEKYGAPKIHTRIEQFENETVMWTFPSTTITLAWQEDRFLKIGAVTIEYKATDRISLDRL